MLPSPHRGRACLALCLALCAIAWDDVPEYPRVDPDNPGGVRLGDDDGDDGFTGYPADPGDPDDPYYDVSSEYRAYSPNWTGAYLGVSPVVGWLTASADYLDDSTSGLGFGVALQASSVNQILDLQATWLHTSLDAGRGGLPLDLNRDGLAFSAHVHPLFLAILGGNRISYMFANASGFIGPSVNWVRLRGDSFEHTFRTPGWHLGASVGMPIDNVHDGGSMWVELQYRYENISGDTSNDVVDRNHIKEHWLTLRLTWRQNGNALSGFRGPDSP